MSTLIFSGVQLSTPLQVENPRMSRYPAQWRAAQQDRLAASSIWTRFGLIALIAVPWFLTIAPAMFGANSYSAIGLYALAGGFLGNSLREQRFLRLPGASRRTVIAVQRSGQLSGDRALDTIALDRVRRAARTTRQDRILIPVSIAIYVAIPVVAAIRTDAWWLLCLLPGVVLAARVQATGRSEDPRVQLNRLQQAFEA
jgi:hypothetical protein